MGQAMVMSDAELLELSRRGERHAFGVLVERYQSVVSAVSYSRTRDHALSDDVTQDTFIAAWRQLDQLREPSRLRSWLCGIARNLARKARRRGDREVATDADDNVPATTDNPFDLASRAESDRVVAEALERVPDSYRDVLVLYYGEQLSVREVANTLNISEAAALQRLSRGRQSLANGVTQLVEGALRAQRPRRDLVARVLAALPPIAIIAPSRADASTSSHGGSSMLKFVLAATLVAGTTTTVVIASRSGDSTSNQPVAAVATTTEHTGGPARSATLPMLKPGKRVETVPGAVPARPAGPMIADEAKPPIDRATIERLKLTNGPSRGPANAPVTITMFTDLQCPYCVKAQASLDQLFDDYPGKIRLVMKQFPVHRSAELAAEATFAADAQGKFWELDELMIANGEDLSRERLLELGQQAGLNVEQFRNALDNHTYANALAADRETAAALEISATPSFVINGHRVTGAIPVEEMRKTIEAALRDAR